MYKSYFVPIVQEMTAISDMISMASRPWANLEGPCTKSIKISSKNPNFLKSKTYTRI